jgi:hypothetical protein
MNILLRSKTVTLLTILAISYVLLAIVGGFKMYSSVPYWDMWEGYLEFGLRNQDFDLSVWWSQFNEHRIFLSRILFWLDLFLFKGQSIFLILCNYLLGGAIFYCFYKILKTAFPNEKRLRYCLSLYTLAITFSWIQEENYTCAFQSQFLLAYLVPLIGFYCLYLSKENRSFFLIACIAGIASAGTMANGVIALPLMTVLAFFLKMDWKKIAVLGILAVFILCIYFYDYKSLSHHASFTDSLLHQPYAFAKFYLLMIGSPFVYINGSNYLIGVNKLGVLAGLFFNISFLYFMYISIKKKESSSLQLALIFFISYVALTAVAITGSRLGIQAPTTPRYLTPVLMAWTALLVLFVLNMQKAKRFAICPILCFALIILFPWQYLSTCSRKHIVFERQIAALAAKMQVKDRKQIANICQSPDLVLNIAKKAAAKNLSIFRANSIQNVGELLAEEDMDSCKCIGNIEAVSALDDDPLYVKVKGWLFDPNEQKVPSVIRILNTNRKVIGYALTGQERLDVLENNGSKALYSGFSGYMLAEYVNEEVKLNAL